MLCMSVCMSVHVNASKFMGGLVVGKLGRSKLIRLTNDGVSPFALAISGGMD